MPIIISSDYIASIEESASVIESEIGTETVDFVFRKFGANSVEDLNPADLPSSTPSKRVFVNHKSK